MNIVTANRLQDLRKENKLSQEALAEKLGISRQAVSKWERAEASPDTDNLIALAKLYDMSLDDLLDVDGTYAESKTEAGSDNDKDYVHISPKGIHVKDDKSEVHVGWAGIHVDDRENNEKVDIDKNGVFINGEKKDRYWTHQAHGAFVVFPWGFPFVMLVIVGYILLGVFCDAWHPAWLLFFLIPLWYTIIESVKKRDANRFAYPVLAAGAFLLLGFYEHAWHPSWVIFLTIPVYYGIVNFIKALRKKR